MIVDVDVVREEGVNSAVKVCESAYGLVEETQWSVVTEGVIMCGVHQCVVFAADEEFFVQILHPIDIKLNK